jgi:hypothetical protein
MTRPARQRMAAWIAIVAMLALALVPTLSRALAFAGNGGGWAEVCTPQGMKQVPLDPDPAGNSAPTAPSPDACGLCLLAAAGAAPPPAPPAVPLPSRDAAAPATATPAAHPRPSWARAQPRAPPLGA